MGKSRKTKQSDYMNEFPCLRMNKSPFYKESHHDKYVKGKESVKVDFRISDAAYNDLMKYFKANDMTKTEGFKQIIWDKLEMINTFQNRRCFNNIEFIMLIPKTTYIEELNEKSRIIALYNTDEDFIDEFNHRKGFDKGFNYEYDLRYFNDGFFRYEMMLLNSTKESSVYRVNQADLMNWDSLYSRLDELYGLRPDEYNFVRCPLNNYLDVKLEGQFQSEYSRGEHEAIYVFHDFKKSLFCHIQWRYSFEHKNIQFDVSFMSFKEFMKIISNSDLRPLRESLGDLKNKDFIKSRLESMIKGERQFLELLKETLEDI